MTGITVYPTDGAGAVDVAPVDPDAVIDYIIDWTKWLDGDDIATSSWAIDNATEASSANTLKTDGIHFLLFDKNTGEFKTSFSTSNRNITLDRKNPLSFYSQKYSGVIVSEELPDRITSAPTKIEKEELAEAGEEMSKLKIELAVPFWHDDRILGLVLLEAKASKNAYASEDFKLIEKIRSHASANLYAAIIYARAVAR